MIPDEIVGVMTLHTLMENYDRYGNIDMALQVFGRSNLDSACNMGKSQAWFAPTPEAEEMMLEVIKTLENHLGINETCIKVEVRA